MELRSNRIALGVPLAALAVGMVMALFPMFASHFVRTAGREGEGRLVHFLLEHAAMSAGVGAASQKLWDPPVFYPAENVAAYTDTMVGQLPFYGPWRLLGAGPTVAYQAWLVGALILNFAVFYRLLRDCLAAGKLAASMGAFLFAFGSPSTVALEHPQMVARVWLALALLALWKTLRLVSAGQHGLQAQVWVPVFFLALVLQAWSAFYHLFFFFFFCALALVVALGMRQGRTCLLALARFRGPMILVSGVVSVILVSPLIVHYGDALGEVGGRNWASVVRRLPRWHSWLLMGQGSFLYGWLQRPGGPLEVGRFLTSGVHSNGVGLVTMALAGLGLYWGRARVGVRILVWVTLLVVALTTMVPGGFTIWRWVYELVPGADALRAIGRIGLHLAIPVGVGLAVFFQRLGDQRRWAWALILGLLVVAEQARRVSSHDTARAGKRVAEIAELLESDCSAFFLSSWGKRRNRVLAEDAMWAALASGVPTINGRYGSYPSDYPLLLRKAHRWERDEQSGRQMAGELSAWMATGNRDLSGVCWFEVTASRVLGTARRLNLPTLP